MDRTTIEWTLARLTELRSDYAAGNAQLAELAQRQDQLRTSVLRLEGAIRVLEEQMAEANQPQPDAARAG